MKSSPPPAHSANTGGGIGGSTVSVACPLQGYPGGLALSVTAPTQLSPSVTITPQGRSNNHVYTIDNILGKVRPPQESPELDVTGQI